MHALLLRVHAQVDFLVLKKERRKREGYVYGRQETQKLGSSQEFGGEYWAVLGREPVACSAMCAGKVKLDPQ